MGIQIIPEGFSLCNCSFQTYLFDFFLINSKIICCNDLKFSVHCIYI